MGARLSSGCSATSPSKPLRGAKVHGRVVELGRNGSCSPNARACGVRAQATHTISTAGVRSDPSRRRSWAAHLGLATCAPAGTASQAAPEARHARCHAKPRRVAVLPSTFHVIMAWVWLRFWLVRVRRSTPAGRVGGDRFGRKSAKSTTHARAGFAAKLALSSVRESVPVACQNWPTCGRSARALFQATHRLGGATPRHHT